jgi:Serine dehydrogenase proteinase
MPTWGGILNEIRQTAPQGKRRNFDAVRRKYLVALHQHTKRAVILYASKFTSPGSVPPDFVSINDEDLQGLMEVIHGLTDANLDLILHSPGGSLEACEAWVSYLRSKFTNIRVIVPNLAMSAATMLSCSADRIMLGKHSFLGPIDPQLILNTAVGQRMVSAEAILEQFELAQKECKDPSKLGAWLPMLSQYGPDILVKCQHACTMAKNLVQGWLENYMFNGDPQAKKKSTDIAEWLARHRHFKSHGRHIPRSELEAKGLSIDHLEQDQTLQDLVLSVFHATTHTFNGTPAVKIIENHEGHAFVKTLNAGPQVPQLLLEQLAPKPPPAPQIPAPAQPTPVPQMTPTPAPQPPSSPIGK